MGPGAFLVTVLAGPTVPVPLPRAALEALEEIEVTSSTTEPSGFSLKFSIDAHSILQPLLLIGAQKVPAFRVVIVVTIGGIPHVLMDGIVDAQELADQSGQVQKSLTVMGHDLSTAMKNSKDKTGQPYPAMPIPARVLACLAPYARFGVIPLVIPPLLEETKSPTQEIPKHKGTDLDYIKALAKEVGYVFYVDPGPAPGTSVAYFGPEIRVGPPQRALTVDSDGFTNATGMTFYIDGAKSKKPEAVVQEPKTKVALEVPMLDISLANPPFGLVPPRSNGSYKLEGAGSRSIIEVMLKGLSENVETKDAVRASGTLDPVRYGGLLRARRPVGLRGAGMSFDGLYFVKKVKTVIKAGSLTQTFDLVRNGLVSTVPVVVP